MDWTLLATRALREIVLNLRSQGKCILFSSHIMQEVDALCDHVIVISSGLVRFDGSISDFRALAGTASLEDAFVQIAGLGETP